MLALRRGGAAALLAMLTACSGGSNAAPSAPASHATPGTNLPALDAAIALSRLALGALQADAAIGFFSGANHLAIVADPGNAVSAACDAATASAQSVTLEQNATIAVVRTAIYAPGDTHCATSPEAIAVIGYPYPASFPRIGYGYVVDYALSPLESVSITTALPAQTKPIFVDQVDAQTVDFVTNLAATSVPTLPAQLPAGSFPATFPSQFPDASETIGEQVAQSSILSITPGAGYYALVPGSAGITAGWEPFGPIPSTTSPTGDSYAFADHGVFAFGAVSGGTSLSVARDAPAYAVSRSTQDPAALQSGFPLAAGATTFTVGTKTALGQTTTAANFPAAPTNTATFRSDGTIVAAHQHYVDAVNQVAVDLATADGTTLTMTITDLISKKSLIAPATLTVTPTGTLCDYTYVSPAPTAAVYSDDVNNYGCVSQ